MKKTRTQTVLISILISTTLVLSACGGQGSAHLKGSSESSVSSGSAADHSSQGSGSAETDSSQLPGSSSSGRSDVRVDFSALKKTGSMERIYAECFAVDYYEGGFALITIQDEGRFLLIPAESSVPSGVPDDVTVLRRHPKNV